MYQPFVSIICLCYNQEKFLERAVLSALNQTYLNVEVILVDDASADGSRHVIKKLGDKHNLQTILFEKNQGNCKAFNAGFSISRGHFIIDLAADDVLYPERSKIGVSTLLEKGPEYGVHFCDIDLLGPGGASLGTHFKRDASGKLMESVQEGDMYLTLLEKYYISTPTMMMRREVLMDLGGYDEDLSYEDFDFWIRSARKYKYCFTDQVLMQKQVNKISHSQTQYQRKNPHCMSTAKVCEKALKLNQNPAENRALLKRINYELKWALITENWDAADLLIHLKGRIKHGQLRIAVEKMLAKLRLPWFYLFKLFFK